MCYCLDQLSLSLGSFLSSSRALLKPESTCKNMQTVKSSSVTLSVHPLELGIKSLPMADFRPPPLLLPSYHYIRCYSFFSLNLHCQVHFWSVISLAKGFKAVIRDHNCLCSENILELDVGRKKKRGGEMWKLHV